MRKNSLKADQAWNRFSTMNEEAPEELEKPTVSRKRKIIVLVFVVGFWIFFYWYKSFQPPSQADSPPVTQEDTRPANP
jgi:hypothetical protein